jgi:hypothetical protein
MRAWANPRSNASAEEPPFGLVLMLVLVAAARPRVRSCPAGTEKKV